MNAPRPLYRFWNLDTDGTRYRGEPESWEAAVAALVRFRDRWPSQEAWIEPIAEVRR